MKNKKTEYDRLWEKWRDLIGDFGMEFSEIEYISYSLWSKKINDGLPSHQFTARTKQVISKLSNKDDKHVKDLLKRAIKVAKKRNTIVHNPALMQVFQNKTTGNIQPEFTISTFVTGDSIDIFELQELTAEVTDIKTQLYMSLGYLPHVGILVRLITCSGIS